MEDYPTMMTQEEQKKLFAQQMALQGMTGGYTETPSESVDYIREFSEDRLLEIDPETGNVLSGNIPKNTKRMYWSINNPNYVWGNLDKVDSKVLRIMERELTLVDSMYRVNYDAFKDNPTALKMILAKKQDILNKTNQDIHAYVKKTRAKGGRERELMITKTMVAGTTGNQQGRSRGGAINAIRNFFSSGGGN